MQFLRIPLPLIAGLLLLPALSLAEQIRSVGNELIINGVPSLRIETSFAGASPEKRAHDLAHRLENLAFWGQVDVKENGDNRVIVVSGEPVVTVTPEEAAAQHSNPTALATTWSTRIKEALSLPPLKLSDNFVRIPIDGHQTIRVMGSASGESAARTSSASIASVSKEGDEIKISGRTVGHATVSVSAGSSQENVDVEVRPYAANFPQHVDVEVTGAPATAETVKGVLEEALKTKLQGVHGARWSFGEVPPESLGTGQSHTFEVKAWAAASEAFPSGGTVEVTVKNASLDPYTDDDLWYSNNPETVRTPGPLFSDSLKAGGSARLLYHHMNGTMQDMFVRVEAINDSDEPVRLEIIPGDSKPDRDPVRAGMTAADQFMQNWIYSSGEIVTIPAQSAMPISLRRLSPGETASGLCSLRQLDGRSGLLVRTDAFPPLPLDEKWVSALFSSTPWHEVGTHPINQFDRTPCEASPLVYPNPYREDTMSYEVGGRFGFLRIGQKPLERQDDDGVLDGNFGVIYNLTANISNPTNDPIDVEVAYEASAGYAGGLFVVNGSYVKTKLLAPKQVARIARYHLAPGGMEKLNITTIPISGSSYPSTIMIRPLIDAVASKPPR
jgi:hypothetical protein